MNPDREQNHARAGVLYLVGTPLGNDGDFSPRALQLLREVDLIACEDTRTTGLLLGRFDIHKPRVSYHAHNLRTREAELIEKLQAGKAVALVSDAGMPGISDPGYELVQACVAQGLKVSVIPGPSALTTALAASGLDSRRFVFEGFLEVKGKEHREAIERLLTEQRTSVLYEAPHRLVKTLTQLNEAGLGGRKLCLGREMTKRYEEFLYVTVSDALAFYQVNEPRGEFVLVLEGRAEAEARGWVSAHKTDFDAEKFVLASLSAGQKVKTIAQEVAKQSALSSKEAYAYVQELKNRDWKD